MDLKLIGRAIQSHGLDLVKRLKEEQQEIPSSSVAACQERRPPELEIKDERFLGSVRSFIARKSDLLFQPWSPEEKAGEEKEGEETSDMYAIMPPLDSFMSVPSYSRREHFFNSLRREDCVTGVVKSILESGLLVRLLCVDIGPTRHIEDLEIMAYCPVKELPRLYAKESALGAFQEKDIVRGIILSLDSERIIMSLHEKSIPDEKTYPRIGLITEDEFPIHFKRMSEAADKSYEELLSSIMGFNNAGNVKALVSKQGLDERNSYTRYISRLQIPDKEYAEGLQKWQSQKLAHQSVALGVEKFKAGSYLEAIQHFNKALQTDATNVEALVARGALFANKEVFTKAVCDFREALSYDPSHHNAKSYLVETLLTMGKMCEEGRRLEEACESYQQVLAIHPANREATDMLAGCHKLMAVQLVSGQEKPEVKGSDEDGSDGGKKTVVKKDGKSRRKSSGDALNESTQKLLELMEQERVKSASQKKSKKAKHRKGRSSERESRKKKKKRRKHSSSSDSRSRSKKSKRRRRSSSSSSSRISSSSSSSSLSSSEEKKRKRHKADLRQKDKFEAGGGSVPPSTKPTVSETPTLTDPVFQSSSAPSSAFDFFNKSTFIPGLEASSPPPPPPLLQTREKTFDPNDPANRKNPATTVVRSSSYKNSATLSPAGNGLGARTGSSNNGNQSSAVSQSRTRTTTDTDDTVKKITATTTTSTTSTSTSGAAATATPIASKPPRTEDARRSSRSRSRSLSPSPRNRSRRRSGERRRDGGRGGRGRGGRGGGEGSSYSNRSGHRRYNALSRSRSRSAGRRGGGSYSRSRSRSPLSSSSLKPKLTGVAELDMYLGVGRHLQTTSHQKSPSISSQASGSKDRRPSSRGERSLSPRGQGGDRRHHPSESRGEQRGRSKDTRKFGSQSVGWDGTKIVDGKRWDRERDDVEERKKEKSYEGSEERQSKEEKEISSSSSRKELGKEGGLGTGMKNNQETTGPNSGGGKEAGWRSNLLMTPRVVLKAKMDDPTVSRNKSISSKEFDAMEKERRLKQQQEEKGGQQGVKRPDGKTNDETSTNSNLGTNTNNNRSNTGDRRTIITEPQGGRGWRVVESGGKPGSSSGGGASNVVVTADQTQTTTMAGGGGGASGEVMVKAMVNVDPADIEQEVQRRVQALLKIEQDKLARQNQKNHGKGEEESGGRVSVIYRLGDKVDKGDQYNDGRPRSGESNISKGQRRRSRFDVEEVVEVKKKAVAHSRWELDDEEEEEARKKKRDLIAKGNKPKEGGGGLVADYHDEEEEEQQGKESLTELEKFLNDLKKTKKSQWIAEGKMKDKK